MPKLTLQMFCAEAGGRSNQPGRANRILRLTAVPAKDSIDNAKVNDAPTAFNGNLNVDGLTAEACDAFDSGEVYTVTVEITKAAIPAAAPAGT